MKRILLAVCGIATAVTLASAQTPPSSTDPANPQTPQTQAPQTMDPGRDMQKPDKNITLTGCIRSGDAAGQYVLAKPTDASASSETSGTGAVGTSGRAAWALGDKFRLSGKTTDVGQHLNHKVEISGELNKDASSSSYGTAGAAGSAGAAGGASGSANVPEIKVKSVRMISESCS